MFMIYEYRIIFSKSYKNYKLEHNLRRVATFRGDR